MSPQDQLIEIAKLDGEVLKTVEFPDATTGEKVLCVDFPDHGIMSVELAVRRGLIKDYLHSRDAIVPVIEKQDGVTRVLIANAIQDIIRKQAFNKIEWNDSISWIVIVLCVLTTDQLCEALLRATGKWKE